MSKSIPTIPLASTRALDKVLRVQSKVIAKVDRAFHKANQAIEAARAKTR